MTPQQTLKRHFDAEDGTFLFIARSELRWSQEAFAELASAMFDVANEMRQSTDIPKWVAFGFWYCDTWVQDWTAHERFKHTGEQRENGCSLLHDLAYFLFMSESPYQDDTLRQLAKG